MYGLPITNYQQCGAKITALLVVLVGYVCKTADEVSYRPNVGMNGHITHTNSKLSTIRLRTGSDILTFCQPASTSIG